MRQKKKTLILTVTIHLHIYIHTIFNRSKEDPTFRIEKSESSDAKDGVPDAFTLSDDKKIPQ